MKKLITVLLLAALMVVAVFAEDPVCEHNWEPKTVPPTCSETGEYYEECSLCHEKQNEVEIPKTDHELGEPTTTPATCDTDGKVVKVCGVCNEPVVVETITKLGHDWDDGATTPATCTEDGETVFTCKRDDCDETKTETIAKLNHKTKTLVTDTATCAKAGEKIYRCTLCQDLISETSAKKAHDYSIVTGGPTCTERGKYVRECSMCGDKKTDTSYTAALGHTVPTTGTGKFTVTTKATCDTKGEKKGKCTTCNEYVYEEIPATGHDFEGDLFITKVPTKTATGKYYAVCSDCDESVSKTIAKNTTNLSKYTVPPVTASVSSSIVEKGTVVELSCELVGATIYYTTNGKSPTSASYRNEYEDGIKIDATCTLKAVAVYEKDDDISPSALFSKSFVVKAAETTATTPTTTPTTKEEPKVEPAVKDVTIKMTIGNGEAFVNGEKQVLDASPVIRNDRTMLPIRFVAETLGAVIGWNDSTRTVTIVSKTTTIKITIDKDTATVKTGKTTKTVKLDCAAYIDPSNDRTYVPVRFVAENLGAEVGWDDATRTVTLKT